MSARIDPDVANAGAADTPLVRPVALAALAPAAYDPDDRFGGNMLPSDHPKWMQDTLSLSQRSRELLLRLKPVALNVITYWEHRVRSIVIGGQTLSVDTSGSYRLN